MQGIASALLVCCSAFATEPARTEGGSITDRPPIHAELRPATIRAKSGQKAEIEIRIANRSSATVEVHNPLLEVRPWSRALVLAVLGHDGEYIGNLLPQRERSPRWVSKTDWFRVPPGGTLSRPFSFTVGRLPSGRSVPDTFDELPPGVYLLELQIYHHFVSGRPDLTSIENVRRRQIATLIGGDPSKLILPDSVDDDERRERQGYDEWLATLPGSEIYTSERVRLEVMPRTGD